MVAENSDRQALQALRLVCRKLQAAADRPFIDTFFTHRCHMDTKYSLETLASITAVPRLRDGLQSLTFVNATLTFAELLIEPFTQDKDGDVLERIRGPCFPETRKQSSEFDIVYRPLNEELREMKEALHGHDGESGVGLRLMTEIFNNLKTAGIYPAIRVDNGAEHVYGSYELADRFGLKGRVQGRFPTEHGLHSKHFTPAAVMRGLTDSQLPVKDLAFADEVADLLSTYFRNAAKFRSLQHFCSNLSSLELCLYEVCATWGPEEVFSFKRLISSIPCLFNLSLSVVQLRENYPSDFHFGKIFSQTSLKSITLEVIETTAGEIFEKLEPHKATLESLTFQSVNLSRVTPLKWSYILKRLADSFELRKTIIGNIKEDFGSVSQDVVIKGTVEEVRASLTALAINCNGSEAG